MDSFYLENVALYQSLVKQFKRMPSVARSCKDTAGIPSPDMVVTARIRPLLDEDVASGFPCALFPRPDQPGVVDIHDLYNHPRGRPILKSFNYEVDRLFGPDATAQEIYDSQIEDLVSFAWDGGVGTLFAYGQTGSGKTTTISGLEKLVVASLIGSDNDSDNNNNNRRKVYISIIELTGNSAYDLLSSRTPISILEDSLGVTQLSGAEEHLLIQGRRDLATDLIERAASFRRTASTQKNDASSRSHSICRLRIQNDDDGSDGFLYLVDLAGSEAARDVATHGAERMRETREINISLSVLKDCIRGKARADALTALSSSSSGPNKARQRQRERPPHIPFRQSALTKVLKHVFDPSSSSSSGSTGDSTRRTKTVVVACVNPSLADVGPSKNTLRYAELLRVSVPAAAVATNSGSSNSGSRKIESSKTKAVAVASQSTTARPSSRDPDPAITSVPFHKRVRPGMTISYIPLPDHEPDVTPAPNIAQLAVILCPLGVVGDGGGNGPANDARKHTLRHQGDDDAQYLCARVTPGAINESYEVNLWQQIVVDVSRMEKEVILEYDAGTRYYHIAD